MPKIMTRTELKQLLKIRNTPEARFALHFLEKTEGKVYDSSVGKWGVWVRK